MRDYALRTGLFLLAMFSCVVGAAGQPARSSEEAVRATPALVREIQFMLLNVGIDPGPIDGNAGQLTNRAVRLFEEQSALPAGELVNGGPVPAAFLDALRHKAAEALLKNDRPESPAAAAPAQPRPASTPPPAASFAAPPVPAPAPPDRFAGCRYQTEDFRIGGRQYTPQSFLDEGFDGVTARAVTALRQRLEEARQVAANLGGPALQEVQRQAHVLAYFECRQNIEQGAAANSKNRP
jgi:peptidoglycan hydrolase-like protein with peptidoglycan-binding domain